MAYAIWRSDHWEQINGAFTSGEGAGAVSHPANWLETSTGEEREALGIKEIVAVPPTLGELLNNPYLMPVLSDVNGVPHIYYMTQRPEPPAARDLMVQRAETYREERRVSPLTVWGVFPDRAVVVKMDIESRITISGAVQMAGIMKAGGLPFSFTFDDEAGVETTIDADQTIALGLNVATYSGLCDSALRAVKAQIESALAEGATSQEIMAINIKAGYPPSQ